MRTGDQCERKSGREVKKKKKKKEGRAYRAICPAPPQVRQIIPAVQFFCSGLDKSNVLEDVTRGRVDIQNVLTIHTFDVQFHHNSCEGGEEIAKSISTHVWEQDLKNQTYWQT